jgi:hypothetical protein
MVAVIKAGKSLRNALHYNENKVKQEVAKLIHSIGFPKDTGELGFTDKIGRFQKLTELNDRVKVNSVHISLNFDTSENIPVDKLRQISDAYMQKIGFGKQPYLVYRHDDAAHPHIHVVTTNIRADGSYIKLHNIGKNQSEIARKEIEQEFNLVKADSHQRQAQYEIKPVSIQIIIPGKSTKSGIKRAITNVLDAVLPVYKYTSLPELNAVLSQYNILADQGGKESRMQKNNGLVYRVLDEQGRKTGVPIPASDIYNKPTMKVLAKKFIENDALREPHKRRIKNAIDLAILKKGGSTTAGFKNELQKEKVLLVIRQNEQGRIYGLTYVDQLTKCVFNGSDLGKNYSANAIISRLSDEHKNLQRRSEAYQREQQKNMPSVEKPIVQDQTQPLQGQVPASVDETVQNAITDILGTESREILNPELRDDNRKKRKKRKI